MIVGIDISKDWFDAAWQVAGRIRSQQFTYTAEGIEQLLEQTSVEAIFVMEATGTYHTRLALSLFEAIGAKTALELIVVTNGFTRFEDIKALCAYIGVSPTTFRSGSSVRGKGGIAKLGQGRIRQLLYLCTWTARTCNPACKQLYQRLQTAGKPPKVIGIAIAHKLLRQAFAVATKNIRFSPEFA